MADLKYAFDHRNDKDKSKIFINSVNSFFKAVREGAVLKCRKVLNCVSPKHQQMFLSWHVLDGMPPLLWAIEHRCQDVATLLVKYGAPYKGLEDFIIGTDKRFIYYNALISISIQEGFDGLKYSIELGKLSKLKSKNRQLEVQVKGLAQQLQNLNLASPARAIAPSFEHMQSLTESFKKNPLKEVALIEESLEINRRFAL